ncbi:MAG: bifunctional phosphoribosylaminoimidazolecarboxamide formyltransferase/IMP cyclohydrolase [Candidatus Omnitrophica bacterium]|nr:bifunctional phosphoribosylaminoimidazolecarboxamide formyltransferase/IMP cyclohydrolase [Candidatus Omnitrophota bacterium]
MKIKRALISVSDKTGLKELALILYELDVEILSTGGTARAIKEFGIPVVDVSEYTGFPEIMNGRVKTLHPKIHGGLLAVRSNDSHKKQAKEHGIGMIDMVVVNLYPFEKTVAKENVSLEEAIENIDIGGPSMLRSAAKNYKSVAVVMDPAAYGKVIKELKGNKGSLNEKTLKDLALQVFERTSAYDHAIHTYLSKKKSAYKIQEGFPDKVTIELEKIQDLRYGENPHQKAAFYKDSRFIGAGLIGSRQLQGKELSFNNIMDLDAVISAVSEFKEPAAVIIKHTTPCGIATAKTLKEAYIDALECDKLSAFGSVVGFNECIDVEMAETILKAADFVECIVGPSFDEKAKQLFLRKKNLRLIELSRPESKNVNSLGFRRIDGGFLVQDTDLKQISEKDLRTVTKIKPTKSDLKSLLFAWKAVKHVKSNAIVLAKDTKTVGIGAGQMSRVDSVIVAVRKAGSKCRGSVLASDAFFPKSDAIQKAHSAGVKAIIQPGGSIRDKEVIEACDKYGMVMVFTGTRHFRH